LSSARGEAPGPQGLEWYDDASQVEAAYLKKRILHGFGMALILASPLWITFSEPSDYLRFGISLAVGILLLVLSRYTPESKTDRAR
jgi:hypothetical protein